MSIFEPVTISWKGEDYTVSADRVMRLIATVEEHIRASDLVSEKGPPLVRLATAYAAAIRFAGGRVSDEQVYEDFFATGPQVATELATSLLMLMMPPASLRGSGGKKPEPPPPET